MQANQPTNQQQETMTTAAAGGEGHQPPEPNADTETIHAQDKICRDNDTHKGKDHERRQGRQRRATKSKAENQDNESHGKHTNKKSNKPKKGVRKKDQRNVTPGASTLQHNFLHSFLPHDNDDNSTRTGKTSTAPLRGFLDRMVPAIFAGAGILLLLVVLQVFATALWCGYLLLVPLVVLVVFVVESVHTTGRAVSTQMVGLGGYSGPLFLQ